MNDQLHAAREPIAIIGIGCRFPGGANSPEQFWNLLCQGIDAITEVPNGLFDLGTFSDADRAQEDRTHQRFGAFLEVEDKLDTGISGWPRESEYLDPQLRLLLTVCQAALEDAQQSLKRLNGSRTGVYIGVFTPHEEQVDATTLQRNVIGPHMSTGIATTMLPDHVARCFDFRGPTVSVDTACSSSLVAIHLACQSLWDGDTDLAVAGGVNAMLYPFIVPLAEQVGMLSPTGRSRAFDASADGYVRGEGAGIVVLKPLSKALEDGDPIYALIRGTAVNQDRHTLGMVANREAQEALLREAYQQAGIQPGQVQYVEAHGIGTPVGDPLEAHALGTVLSTDRPNGQECLIATVKTNIGHTEAAAGVAGVIKTALAIKHRKIPPHLHLKQPHPGIDLTKLKLRIPTQLEEWPQRTGPAIAGVNALGAYGTNVHVVLEELTSMQEA